MNDREILDQLLESLFRSYSAIAKKLPFYEESESKFTTILNSQTKVARAILDCLSLMGDPKRQLMSRSKGKLDLAKMMEAVERGEKEAHKITLMTFKDASGRELSQGKKTLMRVKRAR